MKKPRSTETPAQTIKRLQKELAEQQAKNAIMKSMIDVFDMQYGAGLRKKYSPKIVLEKQQPRPNKPGSKLSIIWDRPTAIYQRVTRQANRYVQDQLVKELFARTTESGCHVWARKLHYLLTPECAKQGIKLGRDKLFEVLRSERMLVTPAKTYTKTTHLALGLKKHLI